MSRSVACPPSGYARNWMNGQNLVESTKIERLIADPNRKEKKKEKRTTKKGRLEKSRKSREFEDKHEQQQCLPSKRKFQDECEQLEKSGLTEEHEQSQNLCYLSDGSQSVKKRQRKDPPPVESHVKAVPGKPLRIRFVFKKPKEAEVAPQEERACSTSGAQCLAPNEKVAQEDTNASCVASVQTSVQEDNLPSTSRGEQDVALPIDSRKKDHKRSKEARYNALFEEWIPGAISSDVLDVDEDEQDWLFGSKRQEKPRIEAVETDKDRNMNLQSSGVPCWPKAQFLPEVGIYSLPYTIPF